MKNSIKFLFGALLITILFSFTNGIKLPKDWFQRGDKPNSYIMQLDYNTYYSGKSAASIISKDKRIKGFGTLMQTISAKNYRGKTITMKGMLKTENVKKWSGFWLRIDSKDKKVLGFDNMQNKKIKGTADWTPYEITLHVPEHAETLNFGALLVGTGKIWFDDLSFEVRNKKPKTCSIYDKPSNLSFEE